MRRKGLALILSLAMVLAVTGCGKDGDKKSSKGDVKVSEYVGLEAYESDINVDDRFKEAIEQLRSAKATTEQVKEGKVTEEDVVNINYVGSVDGFEFDGGTGTKDLDIDNSDFIDGFAEGLVGKKVGKTVELNLKFPDDYPNKSKDKDGNELVLAGKEVLFKVTINHRTVTKTPDYNDEFVKTHYSAVGSTTAEFDAYIKRMLQVSAAMGHVWVDFLDSCEVKTYPDGEVESYQTYLNGMYVEQLKTYYGTDLKTYLETCSMTEDEWNNELKTNSESVVKQRLVVDAICKEQNLTITKESANYKDLALRLAQLNGVSSVEALEQQYPEDTIIQQLNYEAAQGYIFDNLKINKGERPTEEPTTVEVTTAEETSADK